MTDDDKRDMVERRSYIIAGPIKVAEYRVRDPETLEWSKSQFHMTCDNTVMAVMEADSAKLFADFVHKALGVKRRHEALKAMHCLEGKTITKIELASDHKAIRFTVDADAPIIAKADGDCCSDTWIEHIELPAAGPPAKVLSVGDLDLPGSTDGDDDCLAVYGFRITTDKGDIVIDYRNASNGYYGGHLCWPGESHYGDAFGQNNSTEEWAPLTGDV